MANCRQNLFSFSWEVSALQVSVSNRGKTIRCLTAFTSFFFCQGADVLIEGGTISAVGTDLDGTEDALVIDAEGKMVLPGGVDAATNFHTAKGEGVGVADDFESGTRAALAGKPTYEVYLN